jgi:DNA-binding transcriptional ArsR family regulator
MLIFAYTKGMIEPTITPNFELVARCFRILGDAQRLQIIHILKERQECSVGELAQALQVAQPGVSRHLAMLLGAGLLRRRRAGNMAYFSIAAPFVVELCELMCDGMRSVIEQQVAAMGMA